MTPAGVVLREVIASARAQRVATLVTLLLMLAATATVVVTAGRNAGAEQAVLAKIDAAGTRSLTVRAKGTQPAFTADVVPRLAGFDVVESVTGFGAVTDVTAAALPQGTRVGMLPAYGTLGDQPLADLPPVGALRQLWATPAAMDALGIPVQRGSVGAQDGAEYLVTATVDLPDQLDSMDPILIEPRTAGATPISSIVVVARTPQDLPLVERLVADALADVPRDGLTVESTQALADLRAVIGGELTRQSRGIVLGVLAGAAGTTLVTIWSLVLLRRRDFGRRRALGATRTMLAALVIGQVLLPAIVGSVLGAILGLSLLGAGAHPIPALGYVAALVVLFTLAAALAAIAPATWASRRDPITELRVP